MSPEEIETVVIEPNWENTCAYFAEAMRQHSFEQWAAGPVVSFIEQVRYLALTDPDALERIIARLKNLEERPLAYADAG